MARIDQQDLKAAFFKQLKERDPMKWGADEVPFGPFSSPPSQTVQARFPRTRLSSDNSARRRILRVGAAFCIAHTFLPLSISVTCAPWPCDQVS
jgi:hypothetical protein